MPGFGSGPFGKGPFGEWDWSREVLYRLLPESWRVEDAAQDYVLARFMEGIRGLFDKPRRLIRDYLDLRDPYVVPSYQEGERLIKLGTVIRELGDTEQQGLDGQCQTQGVFKAEGARFEQTDRGKLLLLRGSSVGSNNGTFTIISVLSGSTVLVDPPLEVESTQFRWSLRAYIGDQNTLRVQVLEGDLSDVAPGWSLDDGAATLNILRRQRFRDGVGKGNLIDFASTQGYISTSGRLVVEDASFQPKDVGKPITLGRSDTGALPVQYAVARVYSLVEVALKPITGGADVVLTPDASLRDVVMLPHAELLLEGSLEPVGVALRVGTDLEVIGVSIVRTVSGAFSAEDLGRRLEITNSLQGNDGVYVIASVLSANQVSLASASLFAESALTWAVRAATPLGDQTQVRLRKPALLPYLAQEIGLTLDTQESVARQRSWVANATQWYDIKGTEKSYEVLGLISGFAVDARQLWAVSYAYSLVIPPEQLYEAGETLLTKRGTTGSLFTSPLGGLFRASTASFEPADEGRFIRISGAATLANNARFLISRVLSPTEVEIDPQAGSVTATDANNGALVWYVHRLYTDLPPNRPRFDEVQTDYLTEIVEAETGNASTFRVDMFCWESDFLAEFAVDATAVALLSRNRYRVTLQSATANPFPDAPSVVQLVDNWVFEDVNGVRYPLETLPTGGPPDYQIEILSATAPPLGVGKLVYVCPLRPSCGYCAASSVLVKIAMASIAGESGLAIEKATERLLKRLDEVRPIHVRLVVLLGAALRATLLVTARIEGAFVTGADLYAPISSRFDDIPLDDIPLDSRILFARVMT